MALLVAVVGLVVAIVNESGTSGSNRAGTLINGTDLAIRPNAALSGANLTGATLQAAALDAERRHGVDVGGNEQALRGVEVVLGEDLHAGAGGVGRGRPEEQYQQRRGQEQRRRQPSHGKLRL